MAGIAKDIQRIILLLFAEQGFETTEVGRHGQQLQRLERPNAAGSGVVDGDTVDLAEFQEGRGVIIALDAFFLPDVTLEFIHDLAAIAIVTVVLTVLASIIVWYLFLTVELAQNFLFQDI